VVLQLLSPAGFQRIQFVARARSGGFRRALRCSALLLPLTLAEEPQVRVRPEPCHHADRDSQVSACVLFYCPMGRATREAQPLALCCSFTVSEFCNPGGLRFDSYIAVVMFSEFHSFHQMSWFSQFVRLQQRSSISMIRRFARIL
jgi:hypothetical protein